MKSKTIRVIYFVPEFCAGHDQIFSSQLVGQASALKGKGFECMLISSELNYETVEQSLVSSQMKVFSEVHLFPLYPSKPNSFHFYKLSHNVAKMSVDIISEWKPDVIYLRSASAFRAVFSIARQVNARIVYDARGLSAEEAFLKRGRFNLLAYYHRYRECEAWHRADTLLCVSERFRAYLNTHTGRSDIHVVPCCVNEHQFKFLPKMRHRIREQLNWDKNTPVATYCGGISSWQRIDDVIRLMVEMKSLEPALKCLLLVSDPIRIREMALKSGLISSDFHCIRVPHDSIPDFLSAADVGIILRHNIPMNNVSSPVKIAEYLACGLPVICSPGIGDLSDMIEREKVGISISDDQNDQAYKAIKLLHMVYHEPILRRRAKQLANEKLIWSAYIDTYRRVMRP